MRVNKQLLGGLVFVCVLVALAGAALWLGAPAKRLLGSKLADLLDPGAEQRLSLIGQRRHVAAECARGNLAAAQRYNE